MSLFCFFLIKYKNKDKTTNKKNIQLYFFLK